MSTVDLGALPPALVVPGARERIRAANLAAGRRIAVLDDDPTGSQSVHAVDVVTVLEDSVYAVALRDPGATCFVLTNTRSLAEPDAVRLTGDAADRLLALGETLGETLGARGGPVEIVSRSDSTLRGHLLAEVAAVDAARRRRTGAGYDGVLLAPAYLEAGRFTAGDVHYARVDGVPVPVGETEFARDATFGYRSSDLRELVAEKSAGAIRVEDVHSIGLDDIRTGGPARVAELLAAVTGGAYVVVNATEYADLEIVALGLLEARRAGKSYLYRTGPSFVRALAGIEPRPPLDAHDIWPAGPPGGHGLVVVGSHVGLTSAQVAALRDARPVTTVELDVPQLLDPARRDAHLRATTADVIAGLGGSDVLLLTSRELVRGTDADDSLAVARSVSAAVTEVVRGALAARPGWVLAKGGITSHDVAVRGLGIRRAEVLGQLLPGMVSVFRPVDADPAAVGMPYIVFAGNVGDVHTLTHVVGTLDGDR